MNVNSMDGTKRRPFEMLDKDNTVDLQSPTAFQRCCAICSMLLFEEVVRSLQQKEIELR